MSQPAHRKSEMEKGMARKVFYSFHYQADGWRASKVRNIGVVEGNAPATDNKWEEVKRGGDVASSAGSTSNWRDEPVRSFWSVRRLPPGSG